MNISSGKIISAQKVVIYGPEGIGKSTFASHFPDPLFIDTEGSTKHMDVRRFDRPSSWTMLLDQVRYVRDHPQECKTLVIDTADWAETLCIESVLAKYKKDGVEDFNYGKGYVYISEEFGRLLNLLSDVIGNGIHVVLTAHAKMRKFEQPDELGTYDRWEMKLSKQVAPLCKEWADMVLFANYKTIVVKDGSGENAKSKAQGGRRVMYTSHHPCWDAKNRHNLPAESEFDFKAIAQCFPSATAVAEADAPQPESEHPIQAVIDTLEAAGVPVNVIPDKPPVNIPPELPKALRDLMAANNVDESEIRRTVAAKKYYPFDMPIVSYDPAFISGALIAGWQQLLPIIKTQDDLPF